MGEQGGVVEVLKYFFKEEKNIKGFVIKKNKTKKEVIKTYKLGGN
ncbi:MAG: hypothetical protein V2A57_03510 [Elusimicrobiota bacterium]